MKKGFTLAETMGVIILLGLIAAVTIPFVDNYIKDSKEKAKNANISKIIEAATNWNITYGNTKNCSEKTCYITVDELKNTEFLSKQNIKDPYTKEDLNGEIKISKVNGTYKYEYIEYVYFQSVGDFTSIDKGTRVKPTQYNMYLKANKNNIDNIYVCLNDEGKEFCLSLNDNHSTAEQRVRDLFGFDETWTYSENSRNKTWTKDDSTSCFIDTTYRESICYDSNISIQLDEHCCIKTDAISKIYISDEKTDFFCKLDEYNGHKCGFPSGYLD